VEGKRPRAERTNLFVGPGPLRLVAVVQDEKALGDEEEQEARSDERHDPAFVPDRCEGFWDQVEERHSHDDPARERDRRLQLPVKAQGERAADQSGDDRQAREGDGNPAHAQRAQVP
jgi:hypothetical protein